MNRDLFFGQRAYPTIRMNETEKNTVPPSLARYATTS